MKKILCIYLLKNNNDMRILLLSLALILTSMLLTGQAPFPNKDEIKQFTASKTCVVLEDDPFSSYNALYKRSC